METQKLLQLVQLAKNGNELAFGELYRVCYVPVFRYVYSRTLQKELSEDLTQTTFIRFFEKLGDFKIQNQTPLAYLYTIARNLLTDHWRSAKEVCASDSLEALVDASGAKHEPRIMEKLDTDQALSKLLVHLSDEQREIVCLKYLNECSTEEICTLTGKSPEAIRQTLSRAFKTIRQQTL